MPPPDLFWVVWGQVCLVHWIETHDGKARAVVVTTVSRHCPAVQTGTQGVCVEYINA